MLNLKYNLYILFTINLENLVMILSLINSNYLAIQTSQNILTTASRLLHIELKEIIQLEIFKYSCSFLEWIFLPSILRDTKLKRQLLFMEID